MITPKHASLICLAGLLGLVATQQGCGSDTSGPGASTAGAPVAGAPAAGAPATGGGGAASAGAPAAGAPAGGAPAGGAPAGGAPAGGAPAGGTGGGSAGTGTGGGSAGTGGGGAVTFAQIKTLFGSNCGVGMCHNAASMHLNYQTGDLHALLTSPIAAGNKDCVGTTPVVANDATSFLLKVVKAGGGGACPTGTGTIARMPDNCTVGGTGGKPACLTDVQIKLISDWIAAGAPG